MQIRLEGRFCSVLLDLLFWKSSLANWLDFLVQNFFGRIHVPIAAQLKKSLLFT